MPFSETEIQIPTLQAAIEDELRRSVYQAKPPVDPQFVAMLTYHMGWEGAGAGAEAQGKRIRPLMTLLAAVASGKDWQKALPAAAAVELIHNFSLIHDDIQDKSPLRHGRATVWTLWGEAQAINAGDLMFTLANDTILRLRETSAPSIALESAQILQKACIQLTHGQFLDLSYEKRQVISLDDYWPMIGGKTAALLSAAVELGAVVSEVEPSVREAFRSFGYNLGLAFQVQDDWLGIWGDAAATGKSTESDLVSGKKTLPVLYALERHDLFAERWAYGPITAKDVPGLADQLVREGAQSFTAETAQHLIDVALRDLYQAATDQTARKPLEDLALKLLNRKS